ncbi:ImmA/IrrE family metallo-endopeptidase [Clostridioides difficile]|nr:ImmA/IrrE family metallo-endopeptidase [Clostridioides difficile]
MSKKISNEQKIEFFKEISPLVTEERKKLYGNKSIIDPFYTLEQLDFIVVKFPSKDDKLSGFSIYKGNNKCIYINSNTTKGRQHFSLWHEYYHLVTGNGIGISYEDGEKYNISECKAHMFASLFLMPEIHINKYLYSKNITIPYITNKQILEMANIFKVSFSAMLYRIIQLNPSCKKGLSSRFGCANNYNKLKQIALESNISMEYEEVTNDCYISQNFFKQLEDNYNEGKISEDKLLFVKKLLDKIQENCDE